MIEVAEEGKDAARIISRVNGEETSKNGKIIPNSLSHKKKREKND